MKDADRSALVVDDSVLMRAIVGDLLLGIGFTVETANNGEDAIVKLAWLERLPDVIVVDLMMPGVDGYELIEYLDGTERLKDVPVIVLTGLTRPPLPEGLRVVTKPLDQDQFLATVRECCGV